MRPRPFEFGGVPLEIRSQEDQKIKQIKEDTEAHFSLKESILGRGDVLSEIQEFLEKTPEKTKQFARQEAILHDRLWPALDEEHETVKQVKELVNFLLEQVNLPADFLKVKVFNSAYPDLHVQIQEKTIRISRNFLKILNGDAEKIASALAHEIGHVLLAHYIQIEKPTTTVERNSYDPLNERIQGYEHEYQADRASTIIGNRVGIKPMTLADTLVDIEKSLAKKHKKAKKQAEEKSYDYDEKEYSTWILGSHPHTPRRAIAIKRDSIALPKYPKKFVWTQISIPKIKDFKSINFEKWNPQLLRDDRKLLYPDCVWDEVTAPPALVKDESITEKIKRDESSKEDINLLIGRPAVYFNNESGLKNTSDPISAIPEEINTWQVDNQKQIDKWWEEVLEQFDHFDSYQDVEQDVENYSLEATKILLLNACPEYCLNGFFDDVARNDKDYAKDKKINRVLSGGDPAFYNSSDEILLTTSLLVRNWLKKDTALASIEGLEELGIFLRTFFDKHGEFLPCSNAQFFIHIEKVFKNTKSDEEKNQISTFCKKYERELSLDGKPIVTRLAENMMPSVWQWINGAEMQLFTQHRRDRPYEQYDGELEQKIYEVFENELASAEDTREQLKKIPYNYRPRNLSQQLADIALSINKAIDEEGTSDAVLETDPAYSVALLSEEEFEEKYFGKGRLEYVKSAYISIDKHIKDYQMAAKLWNRAGYPAEFEQMQTGIQKVQFVLETLRVRSAWRDTLLVKALNWKELEHAEDVMEVQKVISKVEEIKTLCILRGVFSNAVLDITVSQRMWELYKKEPHVFLSDISEKEKQSAREDIEKIPHSEFSQELLAILVCFPSPSYVRDELLRSLVDAAPTHEATLAIAAWYSEPPPGVLQPRSVELISVSETFMDILRRMNVIDKQELFLYFLGHKTFGSNIDAQFFPDRKEELEKIRNEAMFGDVEEINKKYPTFNQNNIGKFGSAREQDYVFTSPDSLVFLTKSTGMPIELLLRKQRLFTTKCEQRDFMNYLLFGANGLLEAENKELFLKSVSRNIVDNSAWGKKQEAKDRQNTIDLLAFALEHCPEHRMSDLFLGMWNLQQDKKDLPQVVASLLKEMGSLFVKAGQYLGTQSNSLPIEWIQAFRALSDQNTRAEKTLLYEHEQAVYGVNSPFEKLGTKLGEGSMAAVYKGEIKDQGGNSEQIAAKIVHPAINDFLAQDVEFLDSLVKFINQRRDQFNIRLPDNLAEVSRKQILKELSYEEVVKNYRDMQDVLSRSPDLAIWKIAQIKEEISKPGFIVYNFSEGVSLDRLDPADRSNIEDNIARELFRQIVVEGIYQADPNIGNFRVVVDETLKIKRVDWLDLDHVGRLSQEDRENIRSLIFELFMENQTGRTERLVEYLIHCVQCNNEEDVLKLKPEVKKWVEKKLVIEKISPEKVEQVFTSFLDFLGEQRFVLKEEYVTLLRTLGLMKPFLKHLSLEKLSLALI